ncbi:hypothetical protein NQ315_000525 [Exocentrus adspersus]|uniref:Uncharacterized protein n=1 Tax=Exocentrus adspersus TaxID=1586481 RepID=A0AAV8VCW1_9CUCU|nr:hypothetical protein NQ315_000525 [Exocentrus adspersus]
MCLRSELTLQVGQNGMCLRSELTLQVGQNGMCLRSELTLQLVLARSGRSGGAIPTGHNKPGAPGGSPSGKSHNRSKAENGGEEPKTREGTRCR